MEIIIHFRKGHFTIHAASKDTYNFFRPEFLLQKWTFSSSHNSSACLSVLFLHHECCHVCTFQPRFRSRDPPWSSSLAKSPGQHCVVSLSISWPDVSSRVFCLCVCVCVCVCVRACVRACVCLCVNGPLRARLYVLHPRFGFEWRIVWVRVQLKWACSDLSCEVMPAIAVWGRPNTIWNASPKLCRLD